MPNHERLVNDFSDLVRIDSPSGEEWDVALHVSERLSNLGFQVARDDHGNVIAREDGGGDRPLILSAHMDTVDPGRSIKPQVVGDRITSDGSTILGGDCKAGVAAILEALESVKEDGRPRRPLEVIFTRGEEIGLVGASNLDFSMIRGTEAVVFDGNGPVNTITGASPTYMAFDVNVRGRGAHAGVEPEKGLSAIKIASDLIAELPQGRIDQETTFNVATITGGTVRNAVPSEASVSGEFRSMNMESLELLRMQLLAAVNTVRARYNEAEITENLEMMFQMYRLDPNEATAQLVMRVMRDMSLEPNIKPSGGGTDGNVFRLNGIESVVVGMATNQMHTIDEYVVIPDLIDASRFCEELMTFGA